jgi:20S proteasome subunit beta 1
VANRVSDKLTAMHDRIYCCRSGSAADTQALSDYVRRFLGEHSLEKGALPRVSVAAKLFRSLCYANKDRLLAGIIVAGWDPVDGGSVYALPLGGSCVKLPFAIGGSGSTYIWGLVDAAYRPGMTREECQAFVARALAHAMARDGSSGGVARLVTIDRAGVTRDFVAGDRLPYMLTADNPNTRAAPDADAGVGGAAAAGAAAAGAAAGAGAGRGASEGEAIAVA